MKKLIRNTTYSSPSLRLPAAGFAIISCAILAGCQSSRSLEKADDTAYDIVGSKQEEALGRTEPFRIETPAETLRRRLIEAQGLQVSGAASIGTDALEPPEHWPDDDLLLRRPADEAPEDAFLEETAELSLVEALQVAAANNRTFQSQKENVFLTALDLDLERHQFRNTYRGMMEGLIGTDQSTHTTGVEGTAEVGMDRRLESGAQLSTRIGLDVARLLSSPRSSSMGLFFDASATVPLLRGAGRHIATEPLTQAERNIIYAIWSFERFKSTFAVDVASDYLRLLQTMDAVRNAEANLERQVENRRRSEALYREERLPIIDLDQARQSELSAQERLIAAENNVERAMDNFKVLLGLPADARISLDPDELGRVSEIVLERLGETPVIQPGESPEQPEYRDRNGGPLEIEERRAVELAFDHRLDLHSEHGRVFDAQRRVVVAANGMLPELNLTGNAAFGERRSIATATASDGHLRPGDGAYSAGLQMELPLDRTAERNLYRESYVRLEAAARDVQDLEDRIKLALRNQLRSLQEERENYRIQELAVRVAERRVESARLLLELGRPGFRMRDLLAAEEALLSAQNSFTGAMISYRLAELELQSDLGLLRVDEKGLYHEYEFAELEEQ